MLGTELTWSLAVAIVVPIVAVCAMVVLCVRYIATTPDDDRPARFARMVTPPRDDNTAPQPRIED